MITNFYNHGQNLIAIIIVLVGVGLITGGLYYYFSKQIPEVPKITEKEVLPARLKSTIQKINEHCLRIVGSGEKGVDIFIVGSNYPSNSILWNSDYYNLADFEINLENDVIRLLYSADYGFGYGILTIEPFTSNLDRTNVYLITESFQGDWSQVDYFGVGKELVEKHCNVVYDREDVIGIINADENPSAYGMGGGNFYISGAFHRAGQHNFEDVGSTFVHELGHAFGLFDVYGSGYLPESKTMIDSTSWPNCDNTAGCPKWCSGPPRLPYKTICDNYNEQECEQHYDDQACVWLPEKDPYFKRQCIQNYGFGYYEAGDVGEQNVGTDCLAGTGCYFGCSSAGWRPTKQNNFANIFSQRIDLRGKKHTLEPVSERFLGEIFECCYPRDCEKYNYSKCSDFAERYPKYSSCNICSQ